MPKIDISQTPERKGSGYPEPYRQSALNRIKKRLGDAGGLNDFGVNLTVLPPGEWSSQRHWHEKDDEFVYVIEGELMLIDDAGETPMRAGDCAAFPKGDPNGHHLVNRSDQNAVYLEIGSRNQGEVAHYPDIDLLFDGGAFKYKNGAPY